MPNDPVRKAQNVVKKAMLAAKDRTNKKRAIERVTSKHTAKGKKRKK